MPYSKEYIENLLFVHLHVHGEHSNLRILDSINKIKKMIKYITSLGQNSLALTDHDNLAGHVKFIKTVKELKKENKIPKDFKPILGNEIYLVDEEEMNIEIKNYISNFYHFLLLAKDAKGHEQLRKLSSKAWNRMFSYKGIDRVPTFYSDIEEIIGEEKGHLIASSACLGGYISQNVLKILSNDILDKQEYKRKIHNFIKWCIDIFGKENFYIELQPSNMFEQIEYNKYALRIAEAYKLKYIITTDAHYLKKEDREIHKAYLTSDDEGSNREVDDFYSSTYFFSVKELLENMNYLDLKYIVEGINNTIEISNKIEIFDLANKQVIPKVILPKKENWFFNEDINNISKKYEWINKMIISNEIYDNYLIALIHKGIKEKIPNNEYKEVFERINIECKEILETSRIKEEPISSYFITMVKNIDIIWEEANAIVAPGRGSAGGFIIDYLIGITQINPLKQGIEMPHWRFICAERPDYPDIDIDVPSHKRDIVFNCLSNYYQSIGGTIVRVCTFGTETAKSTILTACFKKGTLVKTINGNKPIETIKKGDLVYTTSGWESVIASTVEKNRTLINIKTRNSTDAVITCTADHEFLTTDKIHKGRIRGKFSKEKAIKYYPKLKTLHSIDKEYQKIYGYCREIEPKWVQAKDINKNHYGLRKLDLFVDETKSIHWKNSLKRNFGIGISTEIEINEDFCELIGIWLAEGSSNQNAITFTIHQNEVNFKNRIIGLMWKVFGIDNYSIFHRNDSLAINISYSSRQLIEFFRQLFEVDKLSNVIQWNKYIPKKLMFIEPILQLQIFKGWFIGDGYVRYSKPYKEKNVASSEAKGATVSKKLCDDMMFILNRNLINPYVIVEHRENYANMGIKRDCYNLMLYGEKSRKLYDMKYNSNFQDILKFEQKDYSEMDIPVFWNNNVYLKTKIEQTNNTPDNLIAQDVFCLKVPSGNFTVNNTIVHNCRGLKINNDIALYLSSLIPVERGKVWSIEDCYYGNEEKNRKSITEFKNLIDEHEGLLDVALGIQGLINKRSSHPCGILIVNDEFTKYNALMRTPSGELVSQFDLEDSEYVGNIKYDLLNTKTCAMIQVNLEMLVEYGEIEWQGTLRKTYDKYLHPDVIDKDSLEMWDLLNKGELISAFQFDSPVGEQALKAIKPSSLLEATNANNLMRLMVEDGSEQPLEMYVRYKEDINRWFVDMKKFGLKSNEIEIMKKHLLQDYGVCSTQEGMMIISMDKDIAGFNVVESNILRKGVAKKIGDKYEEAHKLLYEKGIANNSSKKLLDYVWDIQIAMQKGYGFSLIHGIEYTYILIQQLNLVYYYPSIFWNTSVLLVESGALEQDTTNNELENDNDVNEFSQRKEKTTNYGTIAKAIGNMQQHNISIVLPDINKADLRFKPDIKNNEIIFGLKGIMKINNETSKLIMSNRPFFSLDDFYQRMVLTKKEVKTQTGKIQNKSLVSLTQTIMLIKAGAFDSIEKIPREEILEKFLLKVNPYKQSINSKTIEKIIHTGIVPLEYKNEMKIYRFRNYILNNKKLQDPNTKTIKWHLLNNKDDKIIERIIDFFNEHFISEMEEDKDYKYDEHGNIWIAMGTTRKGSFNELYKNKIQNFEKWLNSKDCLDNYNRIIFEEVKYNIMYGTISTWEMESMNFYYHEHELAHINKEKYCIEDFNELPEEPVVVGTSKYKGRTYPKFQLSRIIGTVLDKDKTKHSITLLTPTSVVQIKFYSGQFAFYDKQISIINTVDGNEKKSILEEGWFKRGNKLLVTGFRRGDQFKPKRYKNSIFPHSVQLIIDIKDSENLVLQSERIGVDAE